MIQKDRNLRDFLLKKCTSIQIKMKQKKKWWNETCYCGYFATDLLCIVVMNCCTIFSERLGGKYLEIDWALPSGSSRRVTPRSLSATPKACSRFSMFVCWYTLFMSMSLGLRENRNEWLVTHIFQQYVVCMLPDVGFKHCHTLDRNL